MHLTGLWGMPRRVYTYPVAMDLGGINMLSTLGSFLLAVGILLFFFNVLRSRAHGARADENPWDAYTLEWATSSPPPPYNFAVIPTVASRHMLWEDRLNEASERSNLSEGFILDHGKEALATSALDAEPLRILHMPDDTIVPFVLATGMLVLFTGLLLRNLPITLVGGFICAADLVAWFWPRTSLLERKPAHA
jgi:heme/copper-type cytochrome/quinol oxidase subunit 1